MAIRLLLRYFSSSILTSWHSPLACHTPLGFPCHRGNEQGRLGWRLNPWSKGCIQTRMIDQVVYDLNSEILCHGAPDEIGLEAFDGLSEL
jgi:hypothetical protein